MSETRIYQRIVGRILEITFEQFASPTNDLELTEEKFWEQLGDHSKVFVHIKFADETMLLTFRRTGEKTFYLVSSDKTMRKEMDKWVQGMKQRYGRRFRFRAPCPADLEQWIRDMESAFSPPKP